MFVVVGVKINHDGEVNRARAMPQGKVPSSSSSAKLCFVDEFFIATKAVSGEIFVFDVRYGLRELFTCLKCCF